MNIFVQSAINLQTYRMVAYKHIIIVTIISFCQAVLSSAYYIITDQYNSMDLLQLH